MVFGLFESKSEKLTKKYFKISREMWACTRRILNNPDSDWWKNYFFETARHLKEIAEDIRKEMGMEYLTNLEKMIDMEYKKSIYFPNKEEDEFLGKLIDEYQKKNNIVI